MTEEVQTLVERLAREMAEADGYRFDNLAPVGLFATPRMNGKDHWLKLAGVAVTAMNSQIEELRQALAEIADLTHRQQLPITYEAHRIASKALSSHNREGSK